MQAPGREEEELCRNFDRAFLNLYPNFVEKFNALLNPQSRYTPEEGRLNTELRIFALIRLGVSDVNQIADFLRCSPQTIYNYKSKIKKAALNGGDNFEETVRKLGSLSLDAFPSCLPADNASPRASRRLLVVCSEDCSFPVYFRSGVCPAFSLVVIRAKFWGAPRVTRHASLAGAACNFLLSPDAPASVCPFPIRCTLRGFPHSLD